MNTPLSWIAKQVDTHRLLSQVVVAILIFSPGVWAINRNFNDDNARSAQGAIDRGYINCLQQNNNRTVLADVVMIAYDSGGSLDFTKVPSFAKLDEPTKQFFTDLKNLTADQPSEQTDPQSARNRALAKLVLRNCPSEYPTHTPGLSADTPANTTKKP